MEMRQVQDQMGRTVVVPKHPRRIVSIVPSQTELLAYLGAPLVGRTRFCIHPDSIVEVQRVGGTKKLDFERIAALNPDLIIGNKEENEQSDIEALEQLYPVWMSDIVQIPDALAMIHQVGDLVQAQSKAKELIKKLEISLESIRSKASRFEGMKVLYFIWKNPWMLAGKGTFIHEVLEWSGFTNACADVRYPELGNPAPAADLVFLSSEPFPFKSEHEAEIETLIPNSKALVVDGEVFSWYGNRLELLETYLDELAERIALKKA
ncbi:MAG: cobalamin-binding protein [Bacteroidetes bacterium]|nr:MAG: cobalamin-binding protein [Bacteroidota bacterium]